jgi:hypothetical protein
VPDRDAAYAVQVQRLRGRIERIALQQFDVGQYHDADQARFIDQMVPLVLAARRQVSLLTDAYLAALLTQMLGRPVRAQRPINTNELRGVDAREVYARPYVTVWTKLSEGLALDAAVSAGRARVSDLVLSDMQIAKRNTAHAVLSETEEITGYRRTLTGSENCGLCVVASTQSYKRGDLMPIHPGCDCGVRPLVGDEKVDDSLLESAHDAIQKTFGVSDPGARTPDYRKAILVQEHGELGPVLTVRSHRFTGPDDLPRT